MCRAFPGDFEERGLITLQMANGKEIKLLQWTCNYCGYTMFFDPTVTNTAPYRSEGTEEIPDFVKKYSS
jgi:predicted nucleic-acid-binding Zn-ribbon protein